MKINRLILASTSPFRLALLEKAGLLVSGQAPDTDEDLIQAPDPSRLALQRANAKALSLRGFSEEVLVIGADQVLEFDGKAYGKASSAEEARTRLQEFSGQIHRLHSAYSLAFYAADGGAPRLLQSRIITATLGMRELSLVEIDGYIKSGEWKGCAGCYQYENMGAQLFDWVDGDHTTIIGLPILALLKDLRRLGINPLVNRQGPWFLV
ncbi:MAG: Maf family protein [Proteobacteria bacterium]|nr:Maf family protein [Pseudomonadota bacterium]